MQLKLEGEKGITRKICLKMKYDIVFQQNTEVYFFKKDSLLLYFGSCQKLYRFRDKGLGNGNILFSNRFCSSFCFA